LTLKYSSACCRGGFSEARCRQDCAYSLGAGGLEAGGGLEGVVDEPLETSESTDHEDPDTKTLPEAIEADIVVDGSGGTTILVHDGDHGVSGVGDNSAEDTSEVTRHEGNRELGSLGVRVLGGGEDVSVESLDGVLEATELDHGVGDLTHPQRLDALVETSPALAVHDLGPALTSGLGEGTRVRSLHADLQLLAGRKTRRLDRNQS